MMHSAVPFEIDGPRQIASFERQNAGLLAYFFSTGKATFRQWTGYDPPPDAAYLGEAAAAAFPKQWHLETTVEGGGSRLLAVTLLRPYRKGRRPETEVERTESASALLLRFKDAAGVATAIALRKPGAAGARIDDLSFTQTFLARRGNREWRLPRR